VPPHVEDTTRGRAWGRRSLWDTRAVILGIDGAAREHEHRADDPRARPPHVPGWRPRIGSTGLQSAGPHLRD
jgi:hypothetical protein